MARTFNGTNQDIIGASNPITSGSVGTLAYWFNTGVNPSNSISFLVGSGDGSFSGMGFVSGSAKLAYWMGGAASSNLTYTTSAWHHAALQVAAGPTATLYLDGAADNNPQSSGMTTGSGRVSLAVGVGNSSNRYDYVACSLADAAIWNVALTANEIKALAAGFRPGQIRPSALVWWLPLDGIASPEPDYSGFAINGTLENSPTLATSAPPLTLLTPRSPAVLAAAAASTVTFRTTLSTIGTRAGSRQVTP